MTPAIAQLNKLSLPFQLHQYQHDANCKSFGLEAVEKLNVAEECVFKTLVVDVDNSYLAVAIIPVALSLSLKKVAKALSAKKVKMADANKVQSSTGYVLGGVSPIGQKKTLKTLLDSSAKTLKTFYISGGKRGLEIELSPEHLALSLQADYAEITNKS
ncbi:Cys-tRNA(Pro) deacylase [Cognaticolwellia mytili]|uniref:Cys-tRNA(Pro) deacylase n=1 Tax=Cognaticolwellia mytili TaxID=1888913 RepID=UPI000A176624|nr:Cys-tRNA(Pro) deacylase [Cognaticolwellia mytili]